MQTNLESKKCSTCKELKLISYFNSNKATKDGLQYYCKTCQYINNKKNMEKYLHTPKGISAIKKNNNKQRAKPLTNEMRYSCAKVYAKGSYKRAPKIFNLTFDEYVEIALKPCYYCQDQLCKPFYSVRGVGLDRIDNNKGYEVDNVLPCGGFCNTTRGNRLTVSEMITVAKILIEMRKKV